MCTSSLLSDRLIIEAGRYFDNAEIHVTISGRETMSNREALPPQILVNLVRPGPELRYPGPDEFQSVDFPSAGQHFVNLVFLRSGLIRIRRIAGHRKSFGGEVYPRPFLSFNST